jgi:hypothetical protein
MKTKTPTPSVIAKMAASIAIALFASTLSSPLRADLSDFVKIPVSDIDFVTVDATQRGLYFSANGKNYYYNPPVANNPVPIADFIDLLGEAQSLFVVESRTQGINYFDGRTAVHLQRILLQFGKATNLAD